MSVIKLNKKKPVILQLTKRDAKVISGCTEICPRGDFEIPRMWAEKLEQDPELYVKADGILIGSLADFMDKKEEVKQEPMKEEKVEDKPKAVEEKKEDSHNPADLNKDGEVDEKDISMVLDAYEEEKVQKNSKKVAKKKKKVVKKDSE